MAEMTEIEVDGRDIKSMSDLHEFFRNAAELPDYYGETLDALYDVLTDGDYRINLRHRERLLKNLGGKGEAVLRMFDAVNMTNR